MSEDNLATKLDELAEKVLDGVLEDGTLLDVRIDALKVIGNYYVATRKAKLKAPVEPDDTASNFANFGDRIRSVS